jgi:hypothetical protein
MSPVSKCSFTGCTNPPLEDRLFCSEHIDNYKVSDVAAFIIPGALSSDSDEERDDDEESDTREE